MSGWRLPPGVGTGGPIALTLPPPTSQATDAPSKLDDEYWMGEALKASKLPSGVSVAPIPIRQSDV
jgi:hypothetical protein